MNIIEIMHEALNESVYTTIDEYRVSCIDN